MARSHQGPGPATRPFAYAARACRVGRLRTIRRMSLPCQSALGTHPAVRTARFARVLVAAALAALLPPFAAAHDTWLRMAPQQPGSGLLALHLAGGVRYPRSDDSIPAGRVAASGCVDDQGQPHGLLARNQLPQALELRSRVGDRVAACWAELVPAEITLTPEAVQTYLHEVRAPQDVHARWTAQQREGRPWQEVYRKFARVEAVTADATADDLSRLRDARGAALEIVPMGRQPLRAGQPTRYLVLSRGTPVAGQAVEFVSARSPLGVWRQSDADGQLEITLPFAGEWLLRGTAFDAPSPDGVWRTRFATLIVQLR